MARKRKQHDAPAPGAEHLAAAPAPESAVLAPWPQVDKFPIVIGSQITLNTISAFLRLATSGYRREYVDLLDELIERDPGAFAAVSQRVLTVAGARWDLTPPELPPDDPRKVRAREICDDTRKRIGGIADLRASLADLAWAIYYGPTGAEIAWDRRPDGWWPTRLHFLHSRRISYPDPLSWSPHIWDAGGTTGTERTAGAFGLRIDAYPGKFIVHVPHVRSDYPTRDGLGRELAYWLALKGMAARSGTAYLERFGKPWVWASYASNNAGTPQQASPDDVTMADQAARGIGAGVLSAATLPDSIQLKLLSAAGSTGVTHQEFLAYCDQQIATCVRGSTFTTAPGKYGAKGTAETARKGEQEVARYDAACLAETLRHDLVAWIVRLNHPDDQDLTPLLTLRVDEEPGADGLMQLAKDGVSIGLPVDADRLAYRAGLDLVPSTDDAPRVCRLVKPSDPDPDPSPDAPDADAPDDREPDDAPDPPARPDPSAGATPISEDDAGAARL